MQACNIRCKLAKNLLSFIQSLLLWHQSKSRINQKKMDMSIRNDYTDFTTKLNTKSLIEKTADRHSSDAGTKYYLE